MNGGVFNLAPFRPQPPQFQRRWQSEEISSSNTNSNNQNAVVPVPSKLEGSGRRRGRHGTKHKKKKKRLLTTRDRLRALQETNLIRHKSLLTRARLQSVVDLASSRVEYVKLQLYRYWNPDYVAPHEQQPHGTATTQSPDQGLRLPRRTFKYQTVMDGRWWFWNIVLALTPGVMIALFCEFRIQPAQEAFGRKQSLAELRLIMGDDHFNEEWALEMIAARRADELKQWRKDNYGDEDELSSLVEGVKQVWAWAGRMLGLAGSDENDNSNDDAPEETIALMGAPLRATQSRTVPSSSSSSSSSPPPLSAPPLSASSSSTTTQQQPTTTTPQQQPVTATLEEILERLRRLEEQFSNNNNNNNSMPLTKDEATQRYMQQIDDFRKSGTQKRMEGEQFRQWDKYLREVPPPDPNRPKNTESTAPPSSSLSSSLSDYLTVVYSSIQTTVQSLLGEEDNESNAKSSEETKDSTSSSSSSSSSDKSPDQSPEQYFLQQQQQQQQHPMRHMNLDDHDQHRNTVEVRGTPQTTAASELTKDAKDVRTKSESTSPDDAIVVEAPKRPWWGIWRSSDS